MRRLRQLTVRESLTEWARWRGFEPAAHHQLIVDGIEQFLVNDDEVLLIFAPPGSGKSMYVSVLLPSYYLSRYPKNSILAATHSGDFALRWGRRVRNDVILEADTLGIKLAADSQAADRWALETGGEYYGVGAGVGIAGYRADLGVIDDLFGTREDAFSAHIRQKRWDWYVDDFSPRLRPGAKRIVMATRWHLADVSGRILDQMDKGIVKGRVISIAARAGDGDELGREPGEYLWDDPTGYNYGNFLRARERETDPMMWSALYQQTPTPEEGDYFKAEWLRSYDTLPPLETLTIYGASDYAVTSKGGDYTVHIVIGIDPDGVMYVIDLWRQQASSDVWVETFCDLVKKWKPLAWAEEGGQIKSSVGPFLEQRQAARGAYVAREQFPTKGDKAIRAQSIRGRMALHGLYVPARAPWTAEFRRELLTFGAGAHDDQCVADGTLISMADGTQKPVEYVEVGDLVATPIGECAVEATAITNETARVYRIETAGGLQLTATGNHPVYIEGKGFVRVDAIGIMDQIRFPPLCGEIRPKQKSSNTSAIDIADTPTASTVITAGTSGLISQLIAARHAGCVIAVEALSRPVRVRNLTVSRAHVYYANGMLTHNCDALGLIGQLLDKMVAGKRMKSREAANPIGYAPARSSGADSFKVM